jgi:hypothetical protein
MSTERTFEFNDLTGNDARFLMLATSYAAMLISGNPEKVAELREHLLRFGHSSGYTSPEMKRVVSKMIELVEMTADDPPPFKLE